MTKRMLIDASHPEETRVVVVNENLLEDFDFETADKKQLKGNIYLAKVTRVEPSLQAAFVDYGGNRHGFLAFSEIHPDYYQLPTADRRALEEAQRAEREPAGNGADEPAEQAATGANGADDAAESERVTEDPEEEAAEVFDEQARRRSRLLRSYKIQEVIKRRQIMLVQVVKEERGNKGAALTTYLSLAGRYCVLMPNTARGGGISRKIASPADRSRLKAIARELEVPDGMGLIIRTAGQQRNKQEIRRDYEYLLRLWSDIRELTLKSIAPCPIHEEGALVQRAIRDLYARDVDEVLVEGEEAYRTARKVMGMLMPSRARRVKLYKEDEPLFYQYKVEDKLDAMHSPVIDLKSGGSIVIHTTEALTAIDVNSGRATRERNIEETALKTNLEASDEIARQLRLRDLAGLVVIDFIDMSENRNQRATERRLREALKADRARVQLGRISMFGLLELSRQRLRPSFQELSSQPCPSCAGSGVVRSTGSAALQALRAIELEGIKAEAAAIRVNLPLDSALYLLNQKRNRLVHLEARYGLRTEIQVDHDLIPGQFEVLPLERRVDVEDEPKPAPAPAETAAPSPEADEGDGAERKRRRRRRRRRRPDEADSARVGGPDEVAASSESEQPEPLPGLGEQPEVVEGPADVREAAPPEVMEADEPPARPARPRRARAPRRRAAAAAEEAAGDTVSAASAEGAEELPAGGPFEPAQASPEGAAGEEQAPRKPRSRRRRRPAGEDAEVSAAPPGQSDAEAAGDAGSDGGPEARPTAEPEAESGPETPEAAPAPPSAPVEDAPVRAGNGHPAEPEDAGADQPVTAVEEESPGEDVAAEPAPAEEPAGPPRRGWWSRFVRQ